MLLQVYKAMKCGVQPIAVKVVHGTDKRQLSAFVKVRNVRVLEILIMQHRFPPSTTFKHLCRRLPC